MARSHSIAACLFAFVVVLGAPGAAGQRQTYQNRIGWHLVNGVWMRASGQCEWSDLIRFRWRGQQLLIEAKPTNKAVGLLKGGRTAAVDVGAAKDLYQIAAPEIPRGRNVPGVRNPVELEPGERAIYLTATELVEDDRHETVRPLRPRSLIAAPNVLRVLAEGDVDGTRVSVSFMSQQPAGVQLKVTAAGVIEGSPINFSIEARSLDELHQTHRAHVRKYLGPLLRCLRGADEPDLFAPGAADVYSLFDEVKPSENEIASVREILPAMLDPNPDARQAALASLRKLGPTGACAIRTLADSAIAPQQRVFIEQVLRENSRVEDPNELSNLRRDRQFLIDCLEFPDVRVRVLAVRDLSDVLARPIDPAIAKDHRASVRLANELRANTR